MRPPNKTLHGSDACNSSKLYAVKGRETPTPESCHLYPEGLGFRFRVWGAQAGRTQQLILKVVILKHRYLTGGQ